MFLQVIGTEFSFLTGMLTRQIGQLKSPTFHTFTMRDKFPLTERREEEGKDQHPILTSALSLILGLSLN